VVATVLLALLAGSWSGSSVGPLAADDATASSPAPRVVAASAIGADTWTQLRGTPTLGGAAARETITVVSAGDGLGAELVATLADHEGVVATALVRSGTVGLFGSTAADGRPQDVLAPGYRIPVTVTALDPEGFVATLLATADGDLERIMGLAPGRVVLSTSSATLRGVGVGGSVDLGALAGLEVVGVVGDRTARGSEFLVHLADADEVGLGPRESLLVRHDVTGSERLAAAAEGSDDEVRVWQDGQHVRLVLSQVELKKRFGEFAFRLVPGQREVEIDRAFVAEHITVERMPVLGNVRCHRLVMDDLRAALEEIVDAGLEEWIAPRRYGGCFHPRRIGSGRENLSRHSWGIAIDLNVDFALPGAGAVPPDAFVTIMGRHGFRWGGDFTTPDNHHFEWVGEVAQVRPRTTARSG